MKALDVARYIINYSNEKGYPISNLRLQKLLYFVQACYLSLTEKKDPCFDDRIEAWDFGPVVPSVYHEFKQFGNGSIPTIECYYTFDKNNILSLKKHEFSKEIIPADDRMAIDLVVSSFSEFTTSSLVKLTHEQKPWIEARKRGLNAEITNESIQEYFCNL